MVPIDFVMEGDIIPISIEGNDVDDELLVVTAIAWTGDGQVQLYGYGLMGLFEGAIASRPYGFEIEVWTSVWA